jgi:hypothetical protein
MCARISVPALLAFAVMSGAERLAGTSPIRSSLQPTGIVWANRTFATHADFARWLRAHGSSYEAWALRHPSAAAADPTRAAKAHRVAAARGHSRSQDPRHLEALAVAVGIAALLALILLYERRTYDFRGRLQQGPDAVAENGKQPLIAVHSGGVLARDAATALRARVVHPTVATAKAVVLGTGPALVGLLQSGSQRRQWFRGFRQRHPEVAWYAAACAFAAAVGFVVPYLIR